MRTLATDDFNRADVNPLVYPWSNSVGGDLQIVNGELRGASASDNSMIYRGVLPDDAQWAQVRVIYLSSGYYRGPLVRGSATDWVFLDAYSNTHYAIEWYNGGSWTQIGSNSSNAPTLNDVIRLEADGDRFRAYCNNELMIEGYNSSAPSSGYCGIYIYNNAAWGIIDDFACGNLYGYDHPPTEQASLIPTAPNGGWILNRPPLDMPFELNRNSPQARGLVGWWPTINAKGSLINYGVTSTHGTLTNGAYWQSDALAGRAIGFDGDDDYVALGTIPTNHPLQLGQVFALSCWFYQISGGDDWARLIDKSDGINGTNGYTLFLGDTAGDAGRIFCRVNQTNRYTVGNDYQFGQWHHVLYQGNGNLNGGKCYVDGVSVALSTDVAYTMPNVSTGMRIGDWNHSTGREFKGYIADVRVYATNFSDAEAWQFYDPPTRWQLYAPVLKRYYHIPTPHKTRRFSIR